MVVTRRAPIVPAQHLARNPSTRGSQGPSRTSSTKDTSDSSQSTASNIPAASSDGSSTSDGDRYNGLDNKKTKKSRRRGKNKYQKSNFQAFLDFLTKLLLLAFTIYIFYVCPQDAHPQSPICRGLTEYKRIVLDPYIIPPIQAVFTHPCVAPHIERAKPYVQSAVEITAPILLRTQREWNLRVVPQWEGLIVPEWNRRVLPQWNKYVTPQWNKYLAPRIQSVRSKVEPYRMFIVQRYTERIAPRARVAFYNLQRWRRQAEPYVLLVVSKTKDGYHAAKPYAVPLAKQSGRILHQFALFLREQRQKYVDPHVAKIWEKVKELSSGQVVRKGAPEPGPFASETTFTVLEPVGYETSVPPVQSTASAYDVTPPPYVTDVADLPSSVSADDTVKPLSTSAESTLVPDPEPTPPAPLDDASTTVEFILDADSTLTEPPHETGAPAPEAPSFVGGSDVTTPSVLVTVPTASSLGPPVVPDEPSEPPTPMTQSKITVPAVSATVPPGNSRPHDEIDMNEFYAELGLDEPLENTGSSQEHYAVPPTPPTETDDERAAHLRLKAEETARKRADIEVRQAKWETELETQMARSTSQLRNRLNTLRMAAAAELASAADVRTSIEELVGEAEKYIKGAEIYLKNLKGENRRSEEKLALWDRVADRVNNKFRERLSATEAVVNAWYGSTLEKELEEVATATAEVREIAEKGQLDLGLDYAWLEDVTYNDWQRYHALIGTSERYALEAISIQNGTHPGAMATNPMDSILADLESEVQDVLIGFETRLRRIKRDGERAFNNYHNGAAQKEEGKGSNAVEPDPEVSIPSVSHERGFIPPVAISRSQKQVLEALAKVEPAEETEHLVSGSTVDTGEAVPRLSPRTEGGAGNDHTEL